VTPDAPAPIAYLRAFRLIWAGQSVSQLGSQVTLVALPLTAALVLGASSTQMGLLTAAGFAPSALLGVVAGVWIDRLPRRKLLIASEAVLAITTFTVPLASWLGMLTLQHLLVLQATNGVLTMLSNSARQAYVPGLVGLQHVTQANARLATSASVSQVLGPSMAGAMVQALTAPVAILVDAVSFAFSAFTLLLIRHPESTPQRTVRTSLRTDIHEGLYLALGHRILRPIVLARCTYNFFAAMFTAVYVLFMVRELRLEPAIIGAVTACAGLGGVLGSMLAPRAAASFTSGKAIVGGFILLASMHFVGPVAFGPPLVSAPLLAFGGFFAQLGLGISAVNMTSLQQRLVPSYALGRVSATVQVIGTIAVPVGATLGGVIGDSFGARVVMTIGAIGTVLATTAMLRSPVWTLSSAPDAADANPAPPPSETDANAFGRLASVLED
jgi:MFS family permease